MEKVKFIRLASPTDASVLDRLNEEFNGVRMQLEEIKYSLEQADEIVAIAYLGDDPVGFACAQSFKSFCYRELVGEITEMYIQERARRQGLAGMLLVFLEEQLFARGVSTVKVLTGHDNRHAIAAYEKSGYKREDEVLLEKELGE
ncbi:GNAT family N-acetyltransferase [Paenibacillus sp. BR1-192]|uniref:GNAT family N-acetyltransferase n=1 Tax=Paenibacillus sp. BR1-192 TaxID=3032287 RepID=UPI00240E7B96|nr:GNAT family N-acetyltransferase [Paenibacillus sp. BR1-192]WFB61121.1 GNAT family N-acetyltransferase [Paenibacillus sp. BR1-192]